MFVTRERLYAHPVCIYIYIYIIIIGEILLLFIYIKRLASNEIFSPSNKIHREAGWAKDLSAPLYICRGAD
jgi:hypothetical protein